MRSVTDLPITILPLAATFLCAFLLFPCPAFALPSPPGLRALPGPRDFTDLSSISQGKVGGVGERWLLAL